MDHTHQNQNPRGGEMYHQQQEANRRAERNIQLRWTSHQQTIFTIFQNLFHSECLVDVTLAVEGKYLRAHKVILSACSPYFQELLSLDSSKHPILFMSSDTKFRELKSILDYMYKGETNIQQEDLPALLKLAELLQIRGLADTRALSTTDQLQNPSRDQNSLTHAQTQPVETDTNVELDENSSNDQFRLTLQRSKSPALKAHQNLIIPNNPISFHHGVGISSAPSSLYKRVRRDIQHPSTSTSIRIPMSLPLVEEITTTPTSGCLERSNMPYEEDVSFQTEDIGTHMEMETNQFMIQHRADSSRVKVEVGIAGLVSENQTEAIDESSTSTLADQSVSEELEERGEEDDEQRQNWIAPIGLPGQSGEFERTTRISQSNSRETGSSIFSCPKCHRHYQRKSSLARHIKYECNLPPSFECSFCGLKMKLKTNLDVHERRLLIADDAFYFVCRKGCGRKYLTQSSMQRHERVECGQPATLVCHICKRVFKYKHRLFSHLKNIHKVKC